jgi:hypothetical protein
VALLFEQSGEHPVFDWSIAELAVLGVESADEKDLAS